MADLPEPRRRRRSPEEDRQIEKAYILMGMLMRPPSVRSILKLNLSDTECCRIYREVNGKAPPRGPFPSSAARIVVHSSIQRFHASYICNRAARLQGLGIDGGDLYIRLYRDYLTQFEAIPEEAVLSSDQVHAIVIGIRVGELTMHKCRSCTANFTHVTNEPISRFSCPMCSTLKARNRFRSNETRRRRRTGSDDIPAMVALPGC